LNVHFFVFLLLRYKFKSQIAGISSSNVAYDKFLFINFAKITQKGLKIVLSLIFKNKTNRLNFVFKIQNYLVKFESKMKKLKEPYKMSMRK